MNSVGRAWSYWRARNERLIVRSRWFRLLAGERRRRAERAVFAEPALAGELMRILGHHDDLDEHFVFGFTARPDPISPHKRLADGFAAMALRCGQLRAEALLRRRTGLERVAGRATSKSRPDAQTTREGVGNGYGGGPAAGGDRGVDSGAT